MNRTIAQSGQRRISCALLPGFIEKKTGVFRRLRNLFTELCFAPGQKAKLLASNILAAPEGHSSRPRS